MTKNPHCFVACTNSVGQKFGQGTEGMACLHGVWGLGWGVPSARGDSAGGELDRAELPVWVSSVWSVCSLSCSCRCQEILTAPK